MGIAATLGLFAVAVLVPGYSSATTALLIAFGPTLLVSVQSGYAGDRLRTTTLVGVTPAVSMVLVVLYQELVLGGGGETFWLVFTVLLVSGLLVATVGGVVGSLVARRR